MKREFEGLTPSQSEILLRHFRSLMRDPRTGFIAAEGKASHENDNWVIRLDASFRYNEKPMFVRWKITQALTGQLLSIESLNESDSTDFEAILYDIVLSAHNQVLVQKRASFFQRTYLTAILGHRLRGEYWINNFRFAPLFPDDASALTNAERIFVIDQRVEAIDIEHAREIAHAKTEVIAAYLSFILDVGFDEPVNEYRYFLHDDGSSLNMLRKSTQLVDQHVPRDLPKKGELCQHVRFHGTVLDVNRSVDDDLMLPVETRRIFRGIRQAGDELRNPFRSACRMYRLSLLLGARRPTVRAAYQYGAIDAIVQSNITKYRSYTDFMVKYAEADRATCDYLHSKVRSAHWHSGIMVLGELDFNSEGAIYDPTVMQTYSTTCHASNLTRVAILNWLIEQIGFVQSD